MGLVDLTLVLRLEEVCERARAAVAGADAVLCCLPDPAAVLVAHVGNLPVELGPPNAPVLAAAVVERSGGLLGHLLVVGRPGAVFGGPAREVLEDIARGAVPLLAACTGDALSLEAAAALG